MSKNAGNVRNVLLNLNAVEKHERRKALKDYIFYKGKCISKELAKLDSIWLGQSWKTTDNLDYKPTQDIRNKTKQLLKKQARFMFSVPPDLQLKPNNLDDSDNTEALRQYLNDVFENTNFWKNTKKAFLMATIKKRVLLRVEANEGQGIGIKYEDIDNFNYKMQNGKLTEAVFFAEADTNANYDADDGTTDSEDEAKKVYYLYRYTYKIAPDGITFLPQVLLMTETYTNNDFDTPANTEIVNTGFSVIPCWLIVNGGELGDDYGESDLEDLIEPQTLYNKRNSDFADSLRFQMFGSTVVIDGDKNDVNRLQIRPNGLQAVRTAQQALEKGHQATVQKQEYSMGNSAAIDAYLDRLDRDMRDILDMPSITDLSNIPSAKAMRYMYNDLIARCEEKWADWEPIFRMMINFILEASAALNIPTFDKNWLALKYTLMFTHNYPIPDDSDEDKQTAMSEVTTGVRSAKSYIKEYSDDEDAVREFNDIIAEKALLASAESGSSMPILDDNGNLVTTTSTTEPVTITSTTMNNQGED